MGPGLELFLFREEGIRFASKPEGAQRFGRSSWSVEWGPQARQDSIGAFQDDSSVRVSIGISRRPKQGSHSLPLRSVCLFAKLSWVPAEISQCEDRLHRIGTLNK